MDRETDSNAASPASAKGRRIGNELRAYWEALLAGRPMPARADIDPRGIDRALEFAFILERVAPGMGRFRLAGQHICDLMGMEVRGMPLTSLFAPEGRKQIADLTEAVFARPAIAEAQLVSEAGIGKPGLAGHLVMLPLTDDFGAVTRVLGCFVAEPLRNTGEAEDIHDAGRAPRRFTVTGARIKPLEMPPLNEPQPAGRSPRASQSFEQPAPMPASSGFAEGQTPYTPCPKTRAEHLAEMTPDERRAMFRVVRQEG